MSENTNPYQTPETAGSDTESLVSIENDSLPHAKNKTVKIMLITVICYYLIGVTAQVIALKPEYEPTVFFLVGALGRAIPYLLITIILCSFILIPSIRKQWKTWKIVTTTIVITLIIAKAG